MELIGTVDFYKEEKVKKKPTKSDHRLTFFYPVCVAKLVIVLLLPPVLDPHIPPPPVFLSVSPPVGSAT